MNEPGAGATPVVRRRRRWIVAVTALVLLLIASWWFGRGNSVIDRARLIQMGQPRDEVIRLMGQPQMSGTFLGQGPSEGYSDMTAVELTIRVLAQQYLGIGVMRIEEAFPVRIEYDADRRVSRVRFAPDFE